jgi:hypothetical protein
MIKSKKIIPTEVNIMKKIKIGQIGIGHNHGAQKCADCRRLTDLYEFVGVAFPECDAGFEKRVNNKEYEGLKFMSEEELLAKAENGVYITSLGGLHAGANAISGDFSLQSSGFKIEDGKKTDYIKSFTVAGNFYELLKNVVALADNCRLPRAMGSTTFGAPSVLVDGLSVAGK